MHLGCQAVIPNDYFEDVAYDAAVCALRRRTMQELNDVMISQDVVANKERESISFDQLDGLVTVRLGALIPSCRASLCVRRVFDWPTMLSATQAQRLSSMTERDWKRFLRSVPSRLCADVMLRQCDDHRLLARVFFGVTRRKGANRRRLNKFKIMKDGVQINANGRVYMKQAGHSYGLRGSPRSRMTCVGKCPWTRSTTKPNAVSISVEGVSAMH